MTDRHPGEEALLDLALSDLDDQRRDELTLHLTECESCRVRYAAIVDAVDHVMVAARPVDPPAEFSRSAFARDGHRGQRVGLAVGTGGAAVVLGARTGMDQVVASGSPLLTGGWASVGVVQESRHDGEPVLVVTVTDGVAGTHYECRLVLADGTSRPVGSWALDPAGGGTWVITRPDDAQVVGVEMVSEAGSRWATATI